MEVLHIMPILEIVKNADEDVLKMLVGNKSDLEVKRKVRTESGTEYAKANLMPVLLYKLIDCLVYGNVSQNRQQHR